MAAGPEAPRMWGFLRRRRLLETFLRADANEAALKKIFSDNLSFDGAEPILPGPLAVLAFTNRSGSNLLADYLVQTGRFVGFGESLNHPAAVKFQSRTQCATLPAYITELAQRLGVSQQRHFGIKASASQLAMLLRNRIPAMFSGLRVIHVWRHDIVAQAVSFDIASQTQRWTSLQPAMLGQPDIRPDPRRVEAIIRGLQEQDKSIQYLCAALALKTVSVCYEDLVANPDLTLRRIGDGLGIDFADWRPKPPKIQRQTDQLNGKLIAAYRAAVKESFEQSAKS